ncbi:MAG TPA: maleylpyruvate isomerase N-terminal domain-containing protein, partial [Acidothermaceae bacterium]|nr:maleylpyruvate isomerase N-terminal domain-containing protein [Acidothermaceae bacterium]
MEIPELVDHLADEGARLATAAGQVEWDTPVPRTEWNVRDLVTHLGGVHRWAGDVVRTGAADLDTAANQAVGRGPGDDELLEWFMTGHAALVSALRSAPPDLAAATFLSAPSPLHFWARRQAHETAIHRVDAQQAAAGAGVAGEPAFTPRFAADGIDELIMGFLGRDAKRGSWDGPPGTLTLHADDGADGSAQWRVLSGPGGLAVTREDGAADC